MKDDTTTKNTATDPENLLEKSGQIKAEILRLTNEVQEISATLEQDLAAIDAAYSAQINKAITALKEEDQQLVRDYLLATIDRATLTDEDEEKARAIFHAMTAEEQSALLRIADNWDKDTEKRRTKTTKGIDAFITLLAEVEKLLPYFKDVITQSERDALPIEEVIATSRPEQLGSALASLLEGLQEMTLALPKITPKHIELIDYPVDKINASVWEDLANASKNANGQIEFAMEKRGSKKEATILYSIDFDALEKIDGLKLTKKLTPFDKRVYIAASAIYNQEGYYMTAGQIFATMGNTGKPSKEQLDKINDSLTKMRAAAVYLNNLQEINVNKGYAEFTYDGPLLPFERVSAYINNNLVDSAVHLFREPPLVTFARERKQVTPIEKKLLESPISKTEANLRLDDYLLERIARMKNPKNKAVRKMLYSTIFENCQITTKMQRARAIEKIERYLNHYKACEWIKDYKKSNDGIEIIL